MINDILVRTRIISVYKSKDGNITYNNCFGSTSLWEERYTDHTNDEVTEGPLLSGFFKQKCRKPFI